MSIPNYVNEVAKLRDRHPEAWRNAHTGNAKTEDFIRLLAKHLHDNFDARVGLNGKRGNPNDISDDALNILDAEEGPGSTPDGRRCWVVDVIGGAGGPNPQPLWQAFTDPVASTGAWVRPGTTTPAPPPQPPPPPQYPPYPPNESDVDGAGVALFADFGLAMQAPNPQMFRFAFRVAYSWLTKEVPDLPASVAKHRNEWRAILGLPPQ